MPLDEYGRGKTAKGDERNKFPFNVKKTQPPPPPPSIYTPPQSVWVNDQ